jgi:uncharacterized protein
MISRAGLTVLVTAGLAGMTFVTASAVRAQEQAPMAGALRRAEASITVAGSGTAFARPDTAEVSAGVVTQAATAAQALAENSAGMDKVLKAVAALGIPDKDVQTTNVSVTPQQRQGRPEAQPPAIVGYEASNQVRVKVRDIRQVGRVLDTLVGQGANVLGGVSFSVGDPAPVLDQARTKAIADARRKAEVYTQAAGLTLGPVQSIRESTPGVPRFAGEMPRAMAMSAVPVAPGEQEFQASVTVTYTLK